MFKHFIAFYLAIVAVTGNMMASAAFAVDLFHLLQDADKLAGRKSSPTKTAYAIMLLLVGAWVGRITTRILELAVGTLGCIQVWFAGIREAKKQFFLLAADSYHHLAANSACSDANVFCIVIGGLLGDSNVEDLSFHESETFADMVQDFRQALEQVLGPDHAAKRISFSLADGTVTPLLPSYDESASTPALDQSILTEFSSDITSSPESMDSNSIDIVFESTGNIEMNDICAEMDDTASLEVFDGEIDFAAVKGMTIGYPVEKGNKKLRKLRKLFKFGKGKSDKKGKVNVA